MESAADARTLGTILVIEDDPRIVNALHHLFAMEGYEIRPSSHGTQGLEMFRNISPDAVILDLMLPDIPGREICRVMKQLCPDIPIIILSAISEVADRVLLLELGADDYVTKPFSPRELLARVQAAMRHSKRTIPHAEVSFGKIRLNFASMRANKSEQPVTLTAHEFKLIRFFFDNADRVITRDELLRQVWGYSAYPSTRTVDNQIAKLRQKLEDDPAEPVHFCTVHGAGYRFVLAPGRESEKI